MIKLTKTTSKSHTTEYFVVGDLEHQTKDMVNDYQKLTKGKFNFAKHELVIPCGHGGFYHAIKGDYVFKGVKGNWLVADKDTFEKLFNVKK